MGVSLRSGTGGAPPRLIIQAVFDDKDFMNRMDEMIKGLGRTETAILKMTEASIKADERRAASAARTSKSIIGALRSLRWELVTVLFFVSRISRAITRGFESMAEAAEAEGIRLGIRALADTYEVNFSRVLTSLRAVSDGTLSVAEANQVILAGMLKDQGYFSERYAELWEAARVAAVTTGADTQQVFSAFVEDLVSGTGAATDAIVPIYGLERALSDYAATLGTTADRLSVYQREQVIFNQIASETGKLLEAGADDALKVAAGFEAVAAAWKDAGTSGKALTGQAPTFTTFLVDLIEGAANVRNAFLAVGAGFREMQKEAVSISEEGLLNILTIWERAGDAYSRGVIESIWRMGRAMGQIETPGGQPTLPERQPIAVKDISRMASHFIKYEDIISGHIKKRSDIWNRFFARQATIESNFVRNSNRINRRYNRTRDRAIRNAARREATLTADNYRRLAQLREKYELRVKHFTQTFNQRELRNLAMYQYERGAAIAEGDVLAIEDLDARYKLETKAREENFNLEKRQMEERYELQKKYLLDAMKVQIDALRESLVDQLKEIEVRRKEQLAEEEERRRENLEKANATREQQLLDEDTAHQRSIEQWAAYWRTLAEKAGIGSEEMTAILRAYFGQGGEATKIVDAYLEKLYEWERIYRRVVAITRGAGGGGPSRQRRDRGPPEFPYERGYQHGGQFIANRPTSIMVGEGYAPELVTIQPLRGGGAMSLRWEGGPITVQGSGSLAGMDTQGMGDTIAQGIMVLLQEQFGSA